MSYDPKIDQPIRAAIYIRRFFKKVVKRRGLEPEERHFIEYSPNHPDAKNLVTVTAWVDELRPEPDTDEMPSRAKDAHSAIGTMARVRWEAIEPAYNAWLANQKVDIVGTAIRDWLSTLGMEEAELNQKGALLGGYNVHTVENLVGAPESLIIGLSPQMPDIRFLQQKGQRYLQAKSQVAAAEAIAEKEAAITDLKGENEMLRGEMDEMKGMLSKLLEAQIAANGGTEEAPKRRGRPPGVKSEPTHDEVAA